MAVHDINNWLRFPCAKKPYADSTLRSKTKSEIIQILRDYEHNYEVLWQANERGIKAAQEMLQKAGRWISVTERLPDETGNYLTAFEDGKAMAVNEFMHPRDWLTEEGRKAHPNGKWYWGDVTHWMPLPEPPKEDK